MNEAAARGGARPKESGGPYPSGQAALRQNHFHATPPGISPDQRVLQCSLEVLYEASGLEG